MTPTDYNKLLKITSTSIQMNPETLVCLLGFRVSAG